MGLMGYERKYIQVIVRLSMIQRVLFVFGLNQREAYITSCGIYFCKKEPLVTEFKAVTCYVTGALLLF